MIPEQGPQGGLPVGAASGEGTSFQDYSFNGRPVLSGDHPQAPEHHARVNEANTWLAKNVAHPADIARYHSGDTSALSPGIHAEVQRLQALNDVIIRANQSLRVQANLERMRSLIHAADQQAEGADLHTQVAARLAMFGGRIHHIFDYDNTISDYQGQSTHDMFRTKFPVSEWAELMLTANTPDREIFNTLFAAGWQPAHKQYPELFEGAANLIPIREGADEYFEYLGESSGARATILSGSFEPFVSKSLDRIPHAKGIPVRAVPMNGPTIASIRKGVVIEELVSQYPDEAIIYYGDGESDIPALEAQSQIALFVVLQGCKFHDAVVKEGALHIPFNNFTEVRLKMAHIQGLAQNRFLTRDSA